MLRNEIIKTCAEDYASKCPFPSYDLVIDVTQVYCGGFFHFTIESKCSTLFNLYLVSNLETILVCKTKIHLVAITVLHSVNVQ